MQNKTLLKISLIISILGILLLLLISNNQNPKIIKINEIDKSLLNQKIQTQGNIVSIKNYSTFQLISIIDNQNNKEKINLIINLNKNNKNTELKENQTIKVIGKITEYISKYKTELEIQVDKIEMIN